MNISNVTNYPKALISIGLVTLVTGFIFFFGAPLMAQAEEDYENPPLVGEVRKIYPSEGYLLFKSVDGKRQRIVFTEETILKGVLLAEEIKEKQKVKVWYVVDHEVVKAVKIEVKPELGC